MKKSDPDNIINAPWNMAQIYYIELAKLFRFKENAFLSQDFQSWNNGLVAIFTRIYFKLNEEERKEFEEKFSRVDNCFNNLDKDKQQSNFLYSRIKFLLRDIDKRIMEVMDKYKMIFPNVEIRTLGDFEKSMGINNIEV